MSFGELPKGHADQKRGAWLEIALFLTVWLTFGCLINARNLDAFNLQQAGIEAYVERHHFYLEGSQTPQFHIVDPAGDLFLYRDHVYPAKQPGQFMAGACAYFVLKGCGISYSTDYRLAAALVTFFSASLVAAASVVAVFRIVRRVQPESGLDWPLFVALIYGLGTTLVAYSGIPWHDTLAAGCLAIGCYFIVRLAGAPGALAVSAAGFFLGLTITMSMVPFPMVCVAMIFVAINYPRCLIPFLFGFVGGIAPLLVYNILCFGNPFLLPNIAGNYSDTFPHPTWSNLVTKLNFYCRMISLYVPIFWVGLAGFFCWPRRLAREQFLCIAMIGALALYLLSIDADGTCQYGPRYLLPAMPLAAVGLVGFAFVEHRRMKNVLGLAAVTVGIVSVVINIIGAMHGAMLCYFPHFAAWRYLTEMADSGIGTFPLARWLLLPLIASAALLVGNVLRLRRFAT